MTLNTELIVQGNIHVIIHLHVTSYYEIKLSKWHLQFSSPFYCIHLKIPIFISNALYNYCAKNMICELKGYIEEVSKWTKSAEREIYLMEYLKHFLLSLLSHPFFSSLYFILLSSPITWEGTDAATDCSSRCIRHFLLE